MWKLVLLGVTVFTLVTITGCEVSSPRGGGMAASDGFNVVVAHPDMSLQQGAIETVNLTIARGDNFKQDVKIQIRADKGISVDPGDITVKASDQPAALFHISADKATPLGDYRVTITGTPSSGEPTTTQITVKVIHP